MRVRTVRGGAGRRRRAVPAGVAGPTRGGQWTVFSSPSGLDGIPFTVRAGVILHLCGLERELLVWAAPSEGPVRGAHYLAEARSLLA